MQLFGIGLVDLAHFSVPAGTLHEQPLDIGAIWRGLLVLLVVHDLEIENEVIDGNCVSPGVVLLNPCEESLGEIEPRHPVHHGGSILIPIL